MVPLWPETTSAIRRVLACERAEPADPEVAKLLLRTEQGHALVRQRARQDESDAIKMVTYIDRLGDWFDGVLDDLKLKRRGIGFYTLRHTFRTWADESGDQHAIMRIMGHATPGMSGVYIEEITGDTASLCIAPASGPPIALAVPARQVLTGRRHRARRGISAPVPWCVPRPYAGLYYKHALNLTSVSSLRSSAVPLPRSVHVSAIE